MPLKENVGAKVRSLIRARHEQRLVRAKYSNSERLFSPVLIGYKGGELHCLAALWESPSGERQGRRDTETNWRCFLVSRLEDIALTETMRSPPPFDERGQRCVDTEIDVEV